MCYIWESQRKQTVPSGRLCPQNFQTNQNQEKWHKRDKPNHKAELQVQGYSEERMFKSLQTVWSFRSKEGTWKQSVTTFENLTNTLSVKAYSETVTLPKSQGGEIFHAQGEATGNSVKEELITKKLASKTFPKCGLEKLHGSNFGRRGFYQLLG